MRKPVVFFVMALFVTPLSFAAEEQLLRLHGSNTIGAKM